MHALTIFLSSFLLFSVQPVITKQILPLFGGSSSIWLLSLVFFQSLLLGGYFYSYFITTKLNHQKRIITHGVLLLASLSSLPILYNKNLTFDNEYVKILSMLFFTVGIPYFMLSTTAPLIQAFFTQKYPTAKVYRLYSLSNFASLLALFSYPLFFEKYLSILNQSFYWSASYGFFVMVALGLLAWSFKLKDKKDFVEAVSPISLKTKMKWLSYSFMGSALLSAITAHITQNVASIPLLWILPLAVYLIAFIIAFDYPQLFDKRFLEIALLFLIPFLCFSVLWTFTMDGIRQTTYSVYISVLIYLLGLFLAVYYVNGLLVKGKPHPQQLTIFYVFIALGGVLGSLFVAVISPLIFKSLVEMQLLLSILIVMITFEFKNKVFPIIFLCLTVFINLTAHIGLTRFTIDAERGFYGALSVNEIEDPKTHIKSRFLIHGSIMHGFQTLDPQTTLIPTSYYHKNSGFGRAVTLLQQEKEQISIGMIGMGVGTISSYARDKDNIRFFEIDPLIAKIALKNFTYIKEAKGQVDYQIGDGRLLVEKEPPQKFDLLAVDAFTGDATPVHLLTQEAVQMYMSKIKDDGILAFHVSSGYVNLAAPFNKIAEKENLSFGIVEIGKTKDTLQAESKWVLISKRKDLSEKIKFSFVNPQVLAQQALWTDNYSNILDVFIKSEKVNK
jgi:hypothetical protein